jgi:hypothetical protein
MNQHHHTVEYDEIEYYDYLYCLYPNEKEITKLSLEKYHFICYSWDDPYYKCFGEDTIKKIDELPTLKSDLIKHDWLLIQLTACGIAVPEGLSEIPLAFAECITKMIEETQWAHYPGTNPKVVFDWKSVKRVGASLEITFNHPIPHPDCDWDQTADLLLKLYSRILWIIWALESE